MDSLLYATTGARVDAFDLIQKKKSIGKEGGWGGRGTVGGDDHRSLYSTLSHIIELQRETGDLEQSKYSCKFYL